MTRQILGVSRQAYEEIRDAIPDAIKSESINEQTQSADIYLDDYVIVTVWSNGVGLDLGYKKVILEPEDFREIFII